MPDPDQTRHRNGNDDTAVRRPPRLPSASPASPPDELHHWSGVAALAAGVFGTLLVLGLIGWLIFFRGHSKVSTSAASSTVTESSSAGKNKNLFADTTFWRLGPDPAKQLDGTEQPDVGWWARTFDLPKQDLVVDYLKSEGLTVGKIVPEHYVDTKDDTTITYAVNAEVPAQLLRLKKVAWLPKDPDMIRFTKVLVLNSGLPAGTQWNTEDTSVVAEAGTKLNFAWRVTWDKNFNTVTTDRLPFADNVFTQEQANQYQTESSNTVAQLQTQIQQIDLQVQEEIREKIAQVPANPPKPDLKSTHWDHGDGSGEPTKSAERIGGGTVAGAAGGAAIGAAAGDAGMGAGIGAGVGLLGGFIYDTVSKNNDRHRYERRIAAENEELMDAWRAQVKVLDKQRDQIKQDGLAEEQRQLDDLANTIAGNHGRLDGLPVTIGTSDAPQIEPVTEQATADQASGPISANAQPNGVPGSSSATDAALKQKLVGYWKSPRHAYHYTDDGWVQMVSGTTKNKWNIVDGVYHDYEDDGRDYAYDIVTLTDDKFVYRSRGDDPTTFKLNRISPSEAEEY
jgi:hypothetical protein